MLEYCRQVSSGKDNYDRIAREAGQKANGSVVHLFAKAFMGGWFVGLGGYCACVLASLYFDPNGRNGPARAAFAIVFPSALIGIMITGSDLYTGNTMAFTIALVKGNINVFTYVYKLVVSVAGNYVGAAICALILAGGTNHFQKDIGPGAQYMIDLAKAKTSPPFWRVMFSAVGCNSLVCLAVWSFLNSYDAAGATINVFAQIGTFAAGGLEHLIANFFVLNAALVSNSDVTFADVYVRNFIPVWLGNTIGGVCFMAVPLSIMYCQRDKKAILDFPQKDETQMTEVSA